MKENITRASRICLNLIEVNFDDDPVDEKTALDVSARGTETPIDDVVVLETVDGEIYTLNDQGNLERTIDELKETLVR